MSPAQGDSPEMSGAKRSAQMLDQSGRHIRQRHIRNRVHLFHRRREYKIHADLPADLQVRVHCLWITRVILIRSELKRINENADGDEPALSPCGFNEPDMTGMKRAHRGHQAD